MLNNFFFKYKKKNIKSSKLLYKNKSFAYKIKLKPGFSTLWRLFRQECKKIYQLNFKFQHMLTKYVNIIANIKVYYKLIYWFTNLKSIFKSKFLNNQHIIYIYINGNKYLYIKYNIKFFFKKLFLNNISLLPGDTIQLPLSYKFLILYKNIKIFNELIFTQYDISSLSLIYIYYNTLLQNWGYNKKYSHNLFNFKIYNWKYIT